MKGQQTRTMRIRTLTVLTSLALVLSAGMLSAVDTRSMTEKATEWASANVDRLPSDLESLAAYPVPYRVAAFQMHSPEVRSRLSRQHFKTILDTQQLTPEQRGLISELIHLLGPEAYTDAGRAAAQSAVKPLCARIKETFPQELTSLLGRLGPVGPGETRLVGLARQVKQIVGTGVVYAGLSAGSSNANCSCATDTGCSGCVFQISFCEDRDECQDTWPGCGCGFIWTCDGLCYPIIPER